MSPGLQARLVRVGETFDRHHSMPGRGRLRPLPGPAHGGRMDAFLLSFGIIFVAELGDKSQLMALAFAARYRAVPILIGISLATALVHGFSVTLGAVVGVALPTHAI